MPIVGLWPNEDNKPVANVCTVKRLTDLSMMNTTGATPLCVALSMSPLISQSLLCAHALHGAQAEISFDVGQRGGCEVADSNASQVPPDRWIRQHEASAYDYEGDAAEHIQSFLVGTGPVSFFSAVHDFERHGSLLLRWDVQFISLRK